MSRVINIQEAGLSVVRRLREHGQQALWTGGCVRDMLLGHPPTDIDVATDAPPERVCELFTNTRQVGAKFGVVLVRQGRYWVETATFRTDLSYKDGRRPEGVVFSTPEEDAKRRDFTINGLFYDPIEERVIDFVGGQADLRAGILRAIGEPDRRFGEDHLRLLRAVRFATRFGFVIEPVTAAAIQHHAPELTLISAERIRDELDKMLARASRGRCMELISELSLLAYLWPGAERDVAGGEEEGDISRAIRRLEALPERADFVLSIATLLREAFPARVEEIGRALRCSNLQIGDMAWLVRAETELHRVEELSLAQFKRILAHRRWPDLLALHAAVLSAGGQSLASHDRALRRASEIPANQIAPPPLVGGDDLIALGLKPGPQYKPILDRLYDAQLNGELSDRTQALEQLKLLIEQA